MTDIDDTRPLTAGLPRYGTTLSRRRRARLAAANLPTLTPEPGRALAVYRTVLRLVDAATLSACVAVTGWVGIEHIATDLHPWHLGETPMGLAIGRHQLVGLALIAVGYFAVVETVARRARLSACPAVVPSARAATGLSTRRAAGPPSPAVGQLWRNRASGRVGSVEQVTLATGHLLTRATDLGGNFTLDTWEIEDFLGRHDHVGQLIGGAA